MISHIIDPGQCASCRLCCQFSRASQWETPALTPELVDSLRAHAVPLSRREDGATTFALSYREDDAEDACSPCPVLDTNSGCTLERSRRPLECRIWPLRLMRTEEGVLCITLYRDCSALKDPAVRERLIREATGPLFPFLLRMAEQYPMMVRPLHPAYDVISYLPQEKTTSCTQT